MLEVKTILEVCAWFYLIENWLSKTFIDIFDMDVLISDVIKIII